LNWNWRFFLKVKTSPTSRQPPNAHKLPHKMGIKKARPSPLLPQKKKTQILDFVCLLKWTIGEHERMWQEGETAKTSWQNKLDVHLQSFLSPLSQVFGILFPSFFSTISCSLQEEKPKSFFLIGETEVEVNFTQLDVIISRFYTFFESK